MERKAHVTREIDPRKVKRPYRVEISLGKDEAVLINNKVGIRVDEFRNGDRTNVSIAADRNLRIIRESLLDGQQEERTRQPGIGILTVGFNPRDRQVTYAGNYKLTNVRSTRFGATFRIEATRPMELRGISPNEDMLAIISLPKKRR